MGNIGLVSRFVFNKGKQHWATGFAIVLITVMVMIFTGCNGSASQNGSRLSFETVGQDPTGTITYIASTSTNNVTDEVLGERLRMDWQNKMVRSGDYSRITVVVFDDKEAAKRMVEISGQGLLLDKLNVETARINPHIIAAYHRDTAKGEHAAYFYARDAQMTLVKKIPYTNVVK